MQVQPSFEMHNNYEWVLMSTCAYCQYVSYRQTGMSLAYVGK